MSIAQCLLYFNFRVDDLAFQSQCTKQDKFHREESIPLEETAIHCTIFT